MLHKEGTSLISLHLLLLLDPKSKLHFSKYAYHQQLLQIAFIFLCTSSDSINALIFSLPSSTSGYPHLRLSICSDTQQSLYQHSPISCPLTDHFSFCINSPTNVFITRSVEYLLNPNKYCIVF